MGFSVNEFIGTLYGKVIIFILVVGIILLILWGAGVFSKKNGFLTPMLLRTKDPITLRYFGSNKDLYGRSMQDNYLQHQIFYDNGDGPDYRDDRIFKNDIDTRLTQAIAKDLEPFNCKIGCPCSNCANIAEGSDFGYWDDSMLVKSAHGN